MEWLLQAAAVAVGGWIVEKILNALLDRWRRRRTAPLTDAEVRRFHRRHFVVAAVMFGYVLVLLAIAGAEAIRARYQRHGRNCVACADDACPLSLARGATTLAKALGVERMSITPVTDGNFDISEPARRVGARSYY